MEKDLRVDATEPVQPSTKPEEGEILDEELEQVSGSQATTLSNLANMRHEMLKKVANNLRS